MPEFRRHTAPFLVHAFELVSIRDVEHALELLKDLDRTSIFTDTNIDARERVARDLADRRVFLIQTRGCVPLDAPTVVSLTSLGAGRGGGAATGEVVDDGRRDLLPPGGVDSDDEGLPRTRESDDGGQFVPMPSPRPGKTGTYFALRLLDDRGEALVGVGFHVTLPDGRMVTVETDQQGHLRVEDVAALGAASTTTAARIE